ncbi:MAG: hypothetical protein Q4B86_07235 [Eubacteriales bacterium]|nr:hypothetical protein [Eubacteriales bacterium]
MCTIIQFPKRAESNGYKNLVAFFEICDSVKSCNFYLESAEYLYESGKITENELYTLRRIGRQKRLSLANPESKPIKADKPGTYTYTPEMGQKKPVGCQIEAGLCYYGKHYWVKTSLELKGRGITKNEPARDGRNNYTVTVKAFEKLEAQYAISIEGRLD